MNRKTIIITGALAIVVGLILFFLIRGASSSDPGQDQPVDNNALTSEDFVPTEETKKPSSGPSIDSPPTDMAVDNQKFDESKDVVAEDRKPTATQTEMALGFATQWVTYDSNIPAVDRAKQLAPYTSSSTEWASIDPIAKYLLDDRDSSNWHIQSVATGPAAMDANRSSVYPDAAYVTVNIPVTVTRTNKTNGAVMSGSEVFKLDLDLELSTGKVLKVGGPNDWKLQ